MKPFDTFYVNLTFHAVDELSREIFEIYENTKTMYMGRKVGRMNAPNIFYIEKNRIIHLTDHEVNMWLIKITKPFTNIWREINV